MPSPLVGLALVLFLACGSGMAQPWVFVPATGQSVALSGLQVGATYQLRVSGWMGFGTWASNGRALLNDACYEFNAKGVADPLPVVQNDLGVPVCGPYRADHVYASAPFVAPATQMRLWVFDTDYRDNQGGVLAELVLVAAAGGWANTCTWAFDGECDEPGIGTGLCAAGTDTADCVAAAGFADSCRWALDGECDEPGIGTGLCASGTDTSDCASIRLGPGAADPEADLPADVERRDQALDRCDVWSATNSGGVEGTVDAWDVAGIPFGATFDLRFDAHSVPDRFRVVHEGAIVFESGWRGDASYADAASYPGGIAGPGVGEALGLFARSAATHFTVIVIGVDPSTGWDYSVRCRMP